MTNKGFNGMKKIIKLIYKWRLFRWEIYKAIHDGCMRPEQWETYREVKRLAKQK